MSLWEFTACMDGMLEFHNGAKPTGHGELTDDWLASQGIEGFGEDENG